MAWNLTSPDLSNVESTDLYAENSSFVGCKAVVKNSAENNTAVPNRYNECHLSNLNGPNYMARHMKWGLTWNTWRGKSHSLRESEMAIKPLRLQPRDSSTADRFAPFL